MKILLEKLFAIAMLICISAPLYIAILTIITMILRPIDIIFRKLDWSKYGFVKVFEEFIFVCYIFSMMLIYVPYEILNN